MHPARDRLEVGEVGRIGRRHLVAAAEAARRQRVDRVEGVIDLRNAAGTAVILRSTEAICDTDTSTFVRTVWNPCSVASIV